MHILNYKSWHITAILRSSCLENSQNLLGSNCAAVSFLTKLQADWKNTPDRVFFKNTSGHFLWKLSSFFWQFFTSILEIIESFQERFIFEIIGLFLLFMFDFYTMKPRHNDEPSNWTKQRLSIHASVNVTKIRNFLRSFSKVFVI